MTASEKPEVGWGIFDPDQEITPETMKLLKQLGSLSRGQQDAILVRCIRRHLSVVMELGENPKPTRSQMVSCTTTISNIFHDMLGRP